jgi:hypothetical protein
VTVLELMICARLGGAHQIAHRFLVDTFTTLEFDERAALQAARIGAAYPAPKGAKQSVPFQDLVDGNRRLRPSRRLGGNPFRTGPSLGSAPRSKRRGGHESLSAGA